MVPPRPPPTPDELREAIRDLLGILRAMFAAEREPSRRGGIVAAGRRLTELDAVPDQPDTAAQDSATRAADAAVDAVLGGLHFNASLAPVLGHAASRAILSRRR